MHSYFFIFKYLVTPWWYLSALKALSGDSYTLVSPCYSLFGPRPWALFPGPCSTPISISQVASERKWGLNLNLGFKDLFTFLWFHFTNMMYAFAILWPVQSISSALVYPSQRGCPLPKDLDFYPQGCFMPFCLNRQLPWRPVPSPCGYVLIYLFFSCWYPLVWVPCCLLDFKH